MSTDVAPDLPNVSIPSRPKLEKTAATSRTSAGTPRPFLSAFAQIAQQAHSASALDRSLAMVTRTATVALSACDGASVSLVGPRGPVTVAATHQFARDGDELQYGHGEGPCLDAALKQRWVYARDLLRDDRWPRSSPRLATELGLSSMVSCRLGTSGWAGTATGGLNMYSRQRDGFSVADRLMSVLLASLASVLVSDPSGSAPTAPAVSTHRVFEEAIGVVCSQVDVPEEKAFTMLCAAAHRMSYRLAQAPTVNVARPPAPRFR
jgi:hypothetical protein